MQFTEHSLELSIIELFEKQGYAHIAGSEIHLTKEMFCLKMFYETFFYSNIPH